nr:MAG TPA: hypothetical protein [Caudoviricetes sp.]
MLARFIISFSLVSGSIAGLVRRLEPVLLRFASFFNS